MELEGNGEKFKKLTNVDSLGDSSSDDFNLDDAIEEFSREQNKIEKLSDDEIDFLVEEFAEAYSSDPISSVENESNPQIELLDNKDNSEPSIEDFNALDSDNDCFIVEDESIVQTNKNRDLSILPKNNMAKLSPSEPHGEGPSDNEIQDIKIETQCAAGQQPEKQDTMHHGSTETNANINISVSKIIQAVVVGAFKSEVFEEEDDEMNQDTKFNSGHTTGGLNSVNETSFQGTNSLSNNNDTSNIQCKAVENLNMINELHNNLHSCAENKNLVLSNETDNTFESNNYLNAETGDILLTSEVSDSNESSMNCCSILKSTNKTDLDCYDSVEKQCLNDLITAVCASGDVSSKIKVPDEPDILIESEKLNSSKHDDSLDIVTENFEPIDSEFDCFIVKDSNNVIVIKDDSKSMLSETKTSNHISEKCSSKKSEESKITEIEEVKISKPIENHDKSASIIKDNESSKEELILKENEVSNQNIKIGNMEVDINPEEFLDPEIVCLESEKFETENVEGSNSVVTTNSNLGPIDRNVDIPSRTSLDDLKDFSCDNNFINIESDVNSDSDKENLHSSLENESEASSVDKSDVRNSLIHEIADFRELQPFNHETSNTDSNLKFHWGDIDVNECLGDIVNQVCASEPNGSFEDFENITENKEYNKNDKVVITSVESCSIIDDFCTKIKCVGASSLENQQSSKKRKLENGKRPGDKNKKLKQEDNEETVKPSLIDKIRKGGVFDKNIKKFANNAAAKINFWDYVSKEFTIDSYKKDSKSRKKKRNIIKDMEERIRLMDDMSVSIQLKGRNYNDAQQGKFKEYKYKPQIPVRTVAVNVKIFRDSDLSNPFLNKDKMPTFPEDCDLSNPFLNQDKIRTHPKQVSQCTSVAAESSNKPNINVKKSGSISTPTTNKLKVEKPGSISTLTTNKLQEKPGSSLLPASKTQTSLEIKPLSLQKDASKPVSLTPQFTAFKRISGLGFVSNNVSNPRGMIASPTSPYFMAKSPNITVTGNAIAAVLNTIPRAVTPRSPLNTPKLQLPFKDNGNQVIDLTEDESPSKKSMPSSIAVPVSMSSNSLPKVNLPSGLQSSQNVILPLSGLIQMLPSATQHNPSFTLRNPMQVQPVSRQTIVPSLAPGLLGSRVTYIVPTNSGQINSFARGNFPVPNFLSASNQRLQTVFVRVTNPGSIPPLSTAVSSSARMPVIPQSLRNIGPSNSSIRLPLSSSSSDIVLYSGLPKHPAPFPDVPEYPFNPHFKALPPKPSLKGSRAPNAGIILSWNMTLGREHASVVSYQLFAYQETSGPISSNLWKKVGDVQALPLPMACTLTQFIEGNKYYFTVRAVDKHSRFGPFSDAINIMYSVTKDS